MVLTDQNHENEDSDMNPIQTPGAISWAELLTSDAKAATSFYKALFEWDTMTAQMSTGEYTVGSAGKKPVAGIMNLPAEGIPVYWGYYVTVLDVDAVVAQAQEAGATLMAEPFTVEEVGRMAVIQDPFGAVFSVIAYKEPDHEAHQGNWSDNFQLHGAFSWFELRVADADAAATFYSDLFGWKVVTQQMSQGPYNIIQIGEEGIGGILTVPPEEMPPHWGGYVTVRDIDAFASTAQAEGGNMLFPVIDLPDVGKFTMVTDPQGGVIAGMQYATPA